MNVLIVEDDEHRLKWFKGEIPPSWKIFNTKVPTEAIELLKRHKFDYIFLDHDLESSHCAPQEIWYNEEAKLDFLSKCEGTGYDVAKWLGENHEFSQNKKASIFLHSCNPEGRSRMYNALRENYAVMQFPFPELMQRLKFMD